MRRFSSCLLIAASLPAFAQAPAGMPMTWLTLRDGAPNFDFKAAYPRFDAPSALPQYMNQLVLERLNKVLEEFKANPLDAGSGRKSTLEAKTFVSIASPEMMSLYVEAYTYTGGAHGNVVHFPITLGWSDGEPSNVTLQQLVRPSIDPYDIFGPLVLQKLGEQNAAWVVNGQLTEMPKATMDTFVLTPTAVSFVVGPYVAGPWAEGTRVIKVPYSEVMRYLNPYGVLEGVLKKSTVPKTSLFEGTATYTEKIELPPTAKLFVRIHDVSRADAPAILVHTHEQPVKLSPIGFKTTWNSAFASGYARYRLEVTIEANGEVWFRNADPMVAPLGGFKGRQIKLALVREGQ